VHLLLVVLRLLEKQLLLDDVLVILEGKLSDIVVLRLGLIVLLAGLLEQLGLLLARRLPLLLAFAACYIAQGVGVHAMQAVLKVLWEDEVLLADDRVDLSLLTRLAVNFHNEVLLHPGLKAIDALYALNYFMKLEEHVAVVDAVVLHQLVVLVLILKQAEGGAALFILAELVLDWAEEGDLLRVLTVAQPDLDDPDAAHHLAFLDVTQ